MNRCNTMSRVRPVKMGSRHSSWMRSMNAASGLGIIVASLAPIAISSLEQAGLGAFLRHRKVFDKKLAVAHEAGPRLDRRAVDGFLAMDGEGDHVAVDPAGDRERPAGATEARTVVGVG